MDKYNNTRIYFSDLSIVRKLELQNAIKLVGKTAFNRIYSSEGIFNVKDGKLTRINIIDKSVKNININNTDFIIDESCIIDDIDWYQINPYHISETIHVDTYMFNTSYNNVKLIVEKSRDNLISCYFHVNETIINDNFIVTFLSTLNLC